MKISHDTNGNKVLNLTGKDVGAKRGFSIQTLGNLPETHRHGITPYTINEVRAYVSKYGTKRQRELLDV